VRLSSGLVRIGVASDHERVVELSQEYAVVTAHYTWAVGELNRQRSTVSKEDYERTYAMVESARYECHSGARPDPDSAVSIRSSWQRSRVGFGAPNRRRFNSPRSGPALVRSLAEIWL
jgi:hypothetical protein